MIGQTGEKKTEPYVNLEGVLMLLQLRSEFQFEDVILRHNFLFDDHQFKSETATLKPPSPGYGAAIVTC